MKRLIILALFTISSIIGQTKLLRGIVITEDTSEPLFLANVVVKGTDSGTTTDREGKFYLSISNVLNAVLQISYISYKTYEFPLKEIDFDKELIIRLERKVISSQTVLIEAGIGEIGKTPVTFSKITREEIKRDYTLQDIPEYLSYLPSTTFYSESGNGIGYNYISIRGFDQRRISVSINGIPQNEPEDHNVYWLDMPDLLENTEFVQVQRGAGSGVAGYPAIGGSINLITSTYSDASKYEAFASAGSYNTRKYGVSLSSGLIENKYSISANLSSILSSGYRNNSWVDFKSYNLSAVRFDKKITTQINLFGGPVADGLVYNGLPKWVIKDKEERRKNYSYWEDENGKYTYTAERRPDEIENFFQPHFELLNEIQLSESLKLNSALFLILGEGFFDYDGSWADTSYLRLTNQYGFNPESNPGNVLIRAMVENKQWGFIPRISWNHKKGRLIIGAEFRKHNSIHWGSIGYGENLPQGLVKDHRYYYYEGGKDILNAFVNETYELSHRITLLGELQIAYHKYKIENEKYLNNEFEIDDIYLNPRFGINYKINEFLTTYLSFARVTREPRLKMYYDAAESSGGAIPQFEILSNGKYDFNNPLVKPETMSSFDLGLILNDKKLITSLNFYYMNFSDEIVKRGQVDRFGQPITGNIAKTIHSGIEASLIYKPINGIEVVMNASYSKNYVKEGNTFVNYNDETIEINLTDNSISGFPEFIFNSMIKYYNGNITAILSAKFVGDFYTDNYSEMLNELLQSYPGIFDYSDNLVDAYFIMKFFASYEFELNPLFRKIKLFAEVNNLFDNLYASYGIGKEFFPGAERNFLFGIRLGL